MLITAAHVGFLYLLLPPDFLLLSILSHRSGHLSTDFDKAVRDSLETRAGRGVAASFITLQ